MYKIIEYVTVRAIMSFIILSAILVFYGVSDAGYAFSRDKPSVFHIVSDYGAEARGVSHDNLQAINAAILAALQQGGGTIYFPASKDFYGFSDTIVVPQNVRVSCDQGAVLSPIAPMTDLVRLTASFRGEISGSCAFANREGLAENGINIDPANVGNNFATISGIMLIGFRNNIFNTDADTFIIRNIVSQNATKWDIRSVDNGTGSTIESSNTLGSGGGIYFSKKMRNVEGVKILNNNILATGGQGIRFDGGLKITVANNIFDQLDGTGIFIDGSTGYPAADFSFTNNWVGSREHAQGNLIGVHLRGNVTDVHFSALTANHFRLCGILLEGYLGSAVQRITIEGRSRFANNGGDTGTADICTITKSGGVGQLIVRDSTFSSVGKEVKSVLEDAGTVGFYENNSFSAPQEVSDRSISINNYGGEIDARSGKKR